ncbi:MAG: diguanylate cyclase [Chloroflexota bacterium]|nr:diguanylate cyclase [Chloroflexota bacterium]
MSLRTKLWLVLGLLFLLPMVVAAGLVTVAIPQAMAERTASALATDRAVVTNKLLDACEQLGLAARSLALEAAVTSPRSAVPLAEGLPYVDYAALLGPQADVVAERGALPGAVRAGDLSSCSRGAATSAVIAERVDVRSVPGTATAVTAKTLNRAYLDSLRADNGLRAQILLLDGDSVVATTTDQRTARLAAAAAATRRGPFVLDGWLANAAPERKELPFRVVVLAQRPTTSLESLLLLGLASLVLLALAAVLVAVIARALTQPLAELTDAAERVAKGDLEARIDRSGDGEVGRLSDAFNRMTLELRRNITALEQSRGDLRDSLERIGDTLMSTHDLDGLLEVVLETAVVTLQARVGVALYTGPEQLRLVAEHGLHEAGWEAPTRVVPGTGVLGRVVVSGEVARGRLGSDDSLQPVGTEPAEGDVLAVPVRSMGSVVGVVALYNRNDGRPFDEADEDAMRTLAGQASIAIDNVQLHQEAQRLSTTDPLTGLWNFRYLAMSLAREIERASRFDRPLAVLMLDLDRFKQVNDVYGHACGDAVLRELAHRVSEQVREVDTFARYGGEEFVVVLPETTIQGATQLAERICNAVRREPFMQDSEEPLHVTLSVGVAAFPTHGSSAATLMRAADKALYVAKNEGRDRWHVPTA